MSSVDWFLTFLTAVNVFIILLPTRRARLKITSITFNGREQIKPRAISVASGDRVLLSHEPDETKVLLEFK